MQLETLHLDMALERFEVVDIVSDLARLRQLTVTTDRLWPDQVVSLACLGETLRTLRWSVGRLLGHNTASSIPSLSRMLPELKALTVWDWHSGNGLFDDPFEHLVDLSISANFLPSSRIDRGLLRIFNALSHGILPALRRLHLTRESLYSGGVTGRGQDSEQTVVQLLEAIRRFTEDGGIRFECEGF